MDLYVGFVAAIGVMAHEQTHSVVSQSSAALWIMQFWQGQSDCKSTGQREEK